MTQTPNQTKALTIEQFCAEYGIKRTSLYMEIKAGRLEARKAGTKVLILREEADRWLKALPSFDPPG